MCFNKQVGKNWNAKIATEDIQCYKELRKGNECYYSPCMIDRYFTLNQEGCEKESSFDYDHMHFSSLEHGLHTYSNKKYAIRCNSCHGRIIFNAIIPKGTLYYYNPNDHVYISEKLIVINHLIKK